jgi:hypothetical protein
LFLGNDVRLPHEPLCFPTRHAGGLGSAFGTDLLLPHGRVPAFERNEFFVRSLLNNLTSM